ncbi:MAG: hypothetical protein M3037_04295 [Gemmatimonadota bacterium]|nr:hypothetical protein [Gemmatimonadota bacterium]
MRGNLADRCPSLPGGVLISMCPSTSEEVDPTDAPSSAVSSDSPRTLQRYARLALAVLLALLAFSAFRGDDGYVPLLSEIDLAIHEFGHMLFMPFGIQFLGNTMMILGGSLTQVVFPLLFVGYFVRKREDGRRLDVFAAMVCLWWSAINLLDVSIYCADSRAGELMLLDGLTGKESDGHDWNNLLTRWGLLEHDTVIARYIRAIAWLVCVASIIVAVWSALQALREQPA